MNAAEILRIFAQWGIASDLHSATKELKIEISQAKQNYKLESERKLAANELGSAWASMKTIAGLHNPESSTRVTLNGFTSDLGSCKCF